MIRMTHLPFQQTGATCFRRRETIPGCLEQSGPDMARGRLRWIHEREWDQLLANCAVQRCPVHHVRTTQEGGVGLVMIDWLDYCSMLTPFSSYSPTAAGSHWIHLHDLQQVLWLE